MQNTVNIKHSRYGKTKKDLLNAENMILEVWGLFMEKALH